MSFSSMSHAIFATSVHSSIRCDHCFVVAIVIVSLHPHIDIFIGPAIYMIWLSDSIPVFLSDTLKLMSVVFSAYRFVFIYLFIYTCPYVLLYFMISIMSSSFCGVVLPRIFKTSSFVVFHPVVSMNLSISCVIFIMCS
jgi:hypothetical protein